ncbi:MAG: DMT family transporter [Pikeienuella sp.]
MSDNPAKVVDWRSWAGLSVLVMAWGSSFLLISFALRDLDPFFVTGARIALAALVVGSVARALGGPFPSEARFWLWSAPIGVTALIAPFSLYTWAQVETPSGVVAIYIAAAPLVALVLAHLFTDESITKRGAMGFVVGFAGVVTLIGVENLSNLGNGQLWREVAAAGAAFAFAIGAILVRLAPRYNPLHATAGALIVAAVIYLPFTINLAPEVFPGWRAIGIVAILGLVQTGLAQVTRYLLIKRSGVMFATQTSYLLPIWALMLGWLFLGETLSTGDAAGFALILCGLAVTRSGK